jgi:hypothetical protein
MRNTRKLSLGVLGLAMAAGTCLAQTGEPTKFYKLEFVVKEVEGAKVVNSRAYFMTVPVEAPGQNNFNPGGGSIRTGSRVPVPTSAGGGGFNYIDVGVNIDCKGLRDFQSDVSMYISADISSHSIEPNLPAPLIRQNKWSSTVLVAVKKPTIVYASDDATSKRQVQLELTATPLR